MRDGHCPVQLVKPLELQIYLRRVLLADRPVIFLPPDFFAVTVRDAPLRLPAVDPPLLEVVFRPLSLFRPAVRVEEPDLEAARPVDFPALVLLEEARLEDFAARPPDCFFPPRPAELVDARLDVFDPPADFFPLRLPLVAELPDAVFRLEGGPPEPPFRADPLDEDFPAVVLAEDRLPVVDLSAVDADLRPPPPPFCADRDEVAPDRPLEAVSPLVSSEPSLSAPSAELSETLESGSSKTLPPPPPDLAPPVVAVLMAALSRLAFVEPFGLPRFPRTTPPPNTSSSSSSSSVSSDSVTCPSSSSSSSTSSALSHRRSL